MSRRTRGREPLQDRLTWQAASLLLAYPDAQQTERLDTVDALLGHLLDARGAALRRTAAALRERDFMSAQRDYVETFDLSRRHTLLLTFWTAGDTRNRGVQMLAFAQAYRAAGVEPPAAEAPDHLPVVLEFAATVDPQAGRRLLTEHRVPIDVLRRSLAEAGSAYADAVAAVSATLPAAGQDAVTRLMSAGPPSEAVGLQPFQLTVPPRRVGEGV
ncbi:nitrate reductase molybdenum cofactor assembly chaperone [Mycolicibacterium diernhoferi]|uniref:Nitrate reductase molybdenum cofactor assembly chaperone n=1 Tax=Mycolicibacterium diernhoferi TaxID=1801 RepID=A0A1Q4HFS1_9MYCO|nr:nitrate reductase molybdenum cofactor assembly chaperone [Mycolicibacterium diernhoferi]OJZ66378.1 nitrate reductase molybdenum cofactor assembly chaperone [Mycolicibacterium diernhoferi]OPE55283.1 nitrate reductase molybdenum cofactor assembly chaperone [Mycolicibacterium diernhoferi]PEG54176.1 nitrate reductase molybdenum cofactor assembly chaperone [Mycolicibacterium diernhoferi]QYL24547.1 nitrate reductase molybdenum cofactor assembly chaperone [Mycolicibacterium diernhoferi]